MKNTLILIGLVAAGSLISCGGDDSPAPEETEFTVSLSSSSASVNENAGTVSVMVTSNNANDTGSPLSIGYQVSGSATSGSDFAPLSGTVNIPDGQSSSSFNIQIIDDSDVESNETIQLAVVPSGNVFAGAGVTLTLVDNDEEMMVCTLDNSTDQDNHECDTNTPGSTFMASVSGNTRTINASGIPDHTHGNQFDDFPPNDPNSDVEVTNQNHVFNMTKSPSKGNSSTSILNTTTGRPKYKFGVAMNGVPIDPAPAEPFIFEDDQGEYVWDWVFEPNNNMDAVGLDCAIAHVQPDGAYHYHGDMVPLGESLSSGISTGTAPSSPVQIGWAADGFPIFYRYGPTANGAGVELLTSSYQLKSGNRPGDGVTEPCGTYNGKYTNDYEFVQSAGDLDACNGIDRSVTIGQETFSYFYVITEDFPVISRCFSGSPNNSFQIGG